MIAHNIDNRGHISPSAHRVKDKFFLNQCAELCLEILNNSGFEAYVVGGAVRDFIMNKIPSDFDITTNATSDQIIELFRKSNLKIINTGIKYGTITILYKNGESVEKCEITTYRKDGKYLDSRHPEQVNFLTSLDEDLSRRDFTINAICYSPITGLYDKFNGIDDINAGIIRAIGDADVRFKEDALRILRLVRIASQTGFDIDEFTQSAALAQKSLLLDISSERVTAELTKMLQGDYVEQALCKYSEILEVVLPEIVACRGFDQHTKYHSLDVWEHIARVIGSVKNTPLLRWSALCHDMGKPSTFFKDKNGQGHFYGHAEQGYIITKYLLSRMTLKKSFTKDICTLVKRHNDTLSPTKKSIASTILKMNGDIDLFKNLLELKRADSLGHAEEYTNQRYVYDEIEKLLDEMISQGYIFKIQDLDIDGNDLKKLKIDESIQIKICLEKCLNAILFKNVKNTKDDLIEFLYTNKIIPCNE